MAVLTHPDRHPVQRKEIEEAARSLGLQLKPVAASKSPDPAPPPASAAILRLRAASSISLRCTGSVGCIGLGARTATCFSVGTSSRSSSRRLPIVAPALTVTPVMLPPGRARLLMSPISTGWLRLVKTIGMDVVAFLAAIPADDAEARMTSTFDRTRSSASRGSSSRVPIRNSMTTFWPSTYPSSRRPSRNSSSQSFSGSPARRNPIR